MSDAPLTDQRLPRLLLGIGRHPTARLDSHLQLHGPLPDLRRAAPAQLQEITHSAGLRGRGGAAFPVALKLRAVASRRGRKIVLVNGAEGEPASKKDRVLLRELPHLVLDGAAVAARATGAREAIIAVPETDERSIRNVEQAIAERASARLGDDPQLSLIPVPKRYITGQETALVNYVNTGVAAPTFGSRPFERGVRNHPTLVQNAETLAQLALIARHGPSWFREIGTPDDPGSALITVSGAVGAPGVYEIEHGTPLTDVLESARAPERLRAILIGGYFGSFVDAAGAHRLLLSRAELAPYDATLGAGVIVALGEDHCGVAETARVAAYFAAEGAQQCGPCVNGLSAIAGAIDRISTGAAPAGTQRDVERWCRELPRRGACGHPDGAVRFVASALRVFADEFHDHARHGRCERCANPAALPTPAARTFARAA